MGALQITASVTHWSLVAAVLYVLLQGKVGFVTVLGTLLLSSVAGVITHIPAGLGVLEAVFVSLLAGAHPINQLLAALLAYRAVFYLGPRSLPASLTSRSNLRLDALRTSALNRVDGQIIPHKNDLNATGYGYGHQRRMIAARTS